MNPIISIIVLNWNGGDHVRACIDSLLQQDYANLEIIVVDNGSTDGSVEAISNYRTVRLIENRENLGFAAGNNVGIREASGEYVVILNNDAELDQRCISEMKRAIDKDERYGACASKIYLKFENNVLDAAGLVVCPDGLSIGRGRLESGDCYDREEEVFFASGCCMMCRREMLEDVKIGEDYFDEAFFMYADDTDLGWRARLRGWKTVYAPNARAYHLHSASTENYSPFKAFQVERNRIWVQAKYFPFGMMVSGQLFTALRYLFQAYGAFTGVGASGGFSKQYSKAQLMKVLFGAWAAAIRGMPAVWRKRRLIRQRRTIGDAEIHNLLRLYGVKARQIGLKG